MQVEFHTSSLKKNCEKGTCFRNKKELNDKVQQRIRQLEAADNLLAIKRLPQVRLHSLSWNKRFELAIDINWKTNPNRIVFEALDGENIHDDWLNDLKFTSVTKIKILAVWDYH